MADISATIETLLAAAFLKEKAVLPGGGKAGWLLTALAALLGAAGVVLLILGVERCLAQNYTPDVAAFVTAAIVFVLSGLSLLFARCLHCRKKAVANAARGESLHDMIKALTAELDAPIREHPGTAVLLAALAGFFVAQQDT